MNEIHFEGSALTGENIEEAFTTLIRSIRNRRKDNQSKITLNDKEKKSSSFWSFCNLL